MQSSLGFHGNLVCCPYPASGLGDFAAEGLGRHGFRFRATAYAGVEAVDGGNLLRAAFKIENVEVRGDTFRVVILSVAALAMP